MKDRSMKTINLRRVLLAVITLNGLWLTTSIASCDERENPLTRGQGHVFLRHGRRSCQQSCQPCCTAIRVTQAATAPSSPPSAPVHENATAAPPAKDPELRALLEARRDALQEFMRIQRMKFEMGVGPDNRFPESVTMEYLEAQLELAESKDERIAAIEEALASFMYQEKVAKVRGEVGDGSDGDYPLARAARLKLEIMLHKEKKRK